MSQALPNPAADTSSFWARLTQPVIGRLMANRGLCLVLGAAGWLQIVGTLLGVGGMPCPMMRVVGVPCPGCGLSRACAALLEGEAAHGLHLHAFAPIFILVPTMFLIVGLLPARRRDSIAAGVSAFESNTGLTMLALAGLIVYWAFRLGYAPSAFISLVR